MKPSGLTIIEVLVALVIIAIAFMALASTQIANMRVTRDSQLASISTQVANVAMERVVQQLRENGFACGGVDFPCSGPLTDIEVEGRQYASTYTITVPVDVAVYELAGLARVDVSVTEPTAVNFSQYVSCMDVVPPPSFGNPAPCPAP